MNKQLLREVIRAIEEHPDRYDQGSFGVGNPLSSCGTPCCIAGWATYLSPSYEPLLNKHSFALRYLGANESVLDAKWPREWFSRVNLRPWKRDPVTWARRYFKPTAGDAVVILRAMLEDGRFWRHE